jgi:hypothetical protein
MGPGCASNNARGLCSVSPVSCRKSDSAYIPEQKRPQLQREQPAVADKAGKEKLAKAERCHSEHESWGSSGWRRTGQGAAKCTQTLNPALGQINKPLPRGLGIGSSPAWRRPQEQQQAVYVSVWILHCTSVSLVHNRSYWGAQNSL